MLASCFGWLQIIFKFSKLQLYFRISDQFHKNNWLEFFNSKNKKNRCQGNKLPIHVNYMLNIQFIFRFIR